ncbi:MAG TPA: hypothetical protein VGE77_14035 [Nocardioides sp.]
MSILAMEPAALRGHAARLDVLADEPRAALDAARDTVADHGAFGVLCSFLVPVLAGTQAAGVAACATTVGSLSTAATEVRAVATGVEVTDAAAAATAIGISRAVDAVHERAWPSAVAGAARGVAVVSGAAQEVGERVGGTARHVEERWTERLGWLGDLRPPDVSPPDLRPGPVGIPRPPAGVAP